MVEGVEELGAGFKPGSFAQADFTHHSQVHGVQTGAIDRVAAHIAEGIGRRRGKGRGVEPSGRIARARGKYLCTGNIGADGILADHGSRIGSVAKDGDGQRESGLRLVLDGPAPITREGLSQVAGAKGARGVDRTESEAVSDVAGGAFFCIQIVVVLRNGRLEHRGAKVRSVLERFRERVVGEETEAVGIATARVHIACVIPALRRILEQVDGTDGEGGAGDGDAGREDGVGNKTDLGKGRRGWIKPAPGRALLMRWER